MNEFLQCDTMICIAQYISNLENYISRTKELHWSADNDKVHVLCDELKKELSDRQDEMAEIYMGINDAKFDVGFFSTSKEIQAHTLRELLLELRGDTVSVLSAFSNEFVEYSCVKRVLQKILGYIQAMIYRETQK